MNQVTQGWPMPVISRSNIDGTIPHEMDGRYSDKLQID